MDLNLFKLSQITTSTASIIMGGIIGINNIKNGVGFLCAGMFFTIILRFIEQQIYISNKYHGYI